MIIMIFSENRYQLISVLDKIINNIFMCNLTTAMLSDKSPTEQSEENAVTEPFEQLSNDRESPVTASASRKQPDTIPPPPTSSKPASAQQKNYCCKLYA